MRALKLKKPPSQLRFSLPSIIITITSNEPCNTETHKTDRNPPITNHKPWPFEPVKVKFCFLRDPLRWLTAAKNAIVSWLLNFRIRMFVKRAVISWVTNYVSNLGFLTCLSWIVSMANSSLSNVWTLNLAYKVQNFSDIFGKIPVRILLDVLLCVQVF